MFFKALKKLNEKINELEKRKIKMSESLPEFTHELVCPGCGQELTKDSMTEIYGYCCLNEDCDIGNTNPIQIYE